MFPVYSIQSVTKLLLSKIETVAVFMFTSEKSGEQPNRSGLSISKSTMQKIDAFQATALCFRTHLKCAERTRDRWSWVSDACLPLISPKAKENKWGQGNVCVCVRDDFLWSFIFYRPSALLLADDYPSPEGK